MAGKLQGSDVKSEAELVSAGASKSSLIPDSKIYISSNGINDRLDNAIAAGLIGGGGDSSYLANNKAEQNTNGWATYADAASSVPVDGIGGTPNVTFVRTTTSGEILNGLASFKFSRDATNRQGQGVGAAFTIPVGKQGKMISLSFDYKLISGVLAGSTFANADLRVYVYDVTNSSLIYLSGNDFVGAVSVGNNGTFKSSFQAATNSTSYRLIIHVASTNAVAFAISIDDVTVNNVQQVTGAPVTDWVSYTPTITAFGTVTSPRFEWRRVGKELEVRGVFSSGTPTPSAARVSIPLGLTISNEIYTTPRMAGRWQRNTTASAVHSGPLNYEVGDSLTTVSFGQSFGVSTDSPFSQKFGDQIANNGEAFGVLFSVPILGWSSNMTLSSDGGNRQIGASYYGNALQTCTASVTDCPFATKNYDFSGSWDGSKFTAPQSGIYILDGCTSGNTLGAGYATYLYKNGTQNICIGADTGGTSYVPFNGSIYLNAGDYISIRFEGTRTLSNTNGHHISISKLATPQTIASVETVACRYTTGDGASLSSTPIIKKFITKAFDTHGIYNPATGAITFPYSGTYSIQAIGYVGGVSPTAANQSHIIYIATGNTANSGIFSSVDMYSKGSGIGMDKNILSILVQAKAGDAMSIQESSTVPSGVSGTDANGVRLNIVKVG